MSALFCFKLSSFRFAYNKYVKPTKDLRDFVLKARNSVWSNQTSLIKKKRLCYFLCLKIKVIIIILVHLLKFLQSNDIEILTWLPYTTVEMIVNIPLKILLIETSKNLKLWRYKTVVSTEWFTHYSLAA